MSCATDSYTSVPLREMTPTAPIENTSGGMMPTRHSPAVITPGQFGPIRREPVPAIARLTTTMSSAGMPSVMQMTSGTPASTASRMASAANGAGTKMSEHTAFVSRTASRTVL